MGAPDRRASESTILFNLVGWTNIHLRSGHACGRPVLGAGAVLAAVVTFSTAPAGAITVLLRLASEMLNT